MFLYIFFGSNWHHLPTNNNCRFSLQWILTDNQIKYLDAILNTIADGRKKDGKKTDNSYYICNTDIHSIIAIDKPAVLEFIHSGNNNAKSAEEIGLFRKLGFGLERRKRRMTFPMRVSSFP